MANIWIGLFRITFKKVQSLCLTYVKLADWLKTRAESAQNLWLVKMPGTSDMYKSKNRR